MTFNVMANTFFCNEELGKMPIQQDGRVKPLIVHAKETLKHLTGKTKFEGKSAVMTYCLLSARGLGVPADLKLNVRIEHKDTQKLLDGKKEMPFDELLDEYQVLRTEIMRTKEDGGYKKELQKLVAKANLYNDISGGTNWMMPLYTGSEISWVPLRNYVTEDKVKSFAGNLKDGFATLFATAKKEYDQIEGTKYEAEYLHDKLALPKVAMIISLLGLAALVLFKKFTVALSLSILTVILQTIYLIFRSYISGRAPITNMYETVLFSGYGALVMGLIIGHYKKEKTFVYMGLAYNVCTLLMINFAGSMVSNRISPLVPVLRDNFWLSTHVTTIIISYGALALSWVLANTMMIKRKFTHLSNTDEAYYNDLIYTSLKYGITLLAAGIILGGVWADYSWGRFWGWDPKETWSLIVLCLYMAILHGKYTAWIKNRIFAHLVAAAFMSVMMAWFGVNYILASGLHSYGFSEGGAIFLGSFFAIQILILVITIKKDEVIA